MKSKFLFNSILATGIVGAATLVPISSVLAASVEIGFVIDGSGSVSGPDFELQKDAYVNIFSNNFATNFLSGSVDTLFASFWQFSSSTIEEVSWTTITNDMEALAFANLIDANTIQSGGGTDTAGAINTVANSILTNGIDADNEVIDLSSDGIPNSQSDALIAATNALANGIQVNTLFVGTIPAGQANLAAIAAAGGGTAFVANNFAQYEAALIEKLETDIGGVQTPEPASILGLLTVGLLSLGVRSLKKS